MTDRLAEIRARLEAATPGPWEWWIEDYSMAILGPENWIEDSVVTVGPCSSCTDREKDCAEKENREPEWKWGRCTTPKTANVKFLKNAPTDIRYLLDEIEILRRDHADNLKVTGIPGKGR